MVRVMDKTSSGSVTRSLLGASDLGKGCQVGEMQGICHGLGRSWWWSTFAMSPINIMKHGYNDKPQSSIRCSTQDTD